MPRRSKPGYFVQGEFVVRGSAEDEALIAQRKGDVQVSRTDRKRASQARQDVGESLLGLKPSVWQTLGLSETLIEALQTMHKLTDFGARKRQLQFIGKLMRALDDPTMARITSHTEAQAKGHGQEVAKLHAAEQWRHRLLQDDQAITQWMTAYPQTDVQWLRQTVRAAKQHLRQGSTGQATRQAKAYRALFSLVRDQ
ncbi:MAG: ribosome biogenesis factor YjgA, partial [Burkholderiaceae bacterium]